LADAGFRLVSLRNPASRWGQLACDVYDAADRPFLALLLYPLVSGLIVLDAMADNHRPYPVGAGLLAVAEKVQDAESP